MLFLKLGINGNIGANEWTIVEMHVKLQGLDRSLCPGSQ